MLYIHGGIIISYHFISFHIISYHFHIISIYFYFHGASTTHFTTGNLQRFCPGRLGCLGCLGGGEKPGMHSLKIMSLRSVPMSLGQWEGIPQGGAPVR